MPQEIQAKTAGQKTMRRWFEGRLAERLLQAGQMAEDRASLRRGAKKMQDGTLGQPTDGDPVDEEAMNIRIGDDIHYEQAKPEQYPPAAPPQAPAKSNTLATIATAAALLAGGGLAGYAVNALMKPDPAPVVQPVVNPTVDTDTRYMLRLRDSE